MMESLAESLPKEMSRVREVLEYYKELGSVGAIGSIMIEQSLLEADQAILSGDVVAMLKAYRELQSIE